MYRRSYAISGKWFQVILESYTIQCILRHSWKKKKNSKKFMTELKILSHLINVSSFCTWWKFKSCTNSSENEITGKRVALVRYLRAYNNNVIVLYTFMINLLLFILNNFRNNLKKKKQNRKNKNSNTFQSLDDKNNALMFFFQFIFYVYFCGDLVYLFYIYMILLSVWLNFVEAFNLLWR